MSITIHWTFAWFAYTQEQIEHNQAMIALAAIVFLTCIRTRVIRGPKGFERKTFRK
jgi:hypothetical protein